MQAVTDHLVVVLMAMLMDWPIWCAILAAPVLLALISLRYGGWSDRRRLRAAGLGFAIGAPLGAFAAFAIIGGTPDDLHYWVDVLALAAIALAAGAYAALLAYVAMRPAGTTDGPR